MIYSYGTPHMAEQKQDDKLEHTYSSYVRIRDVALKTCQRRWTIGRSGERGSGISVLAARHDDDDEEIMFSILLYYLHISFSFYSGGFSLHTVQSNTAYFETDLLNSLMGKKQSQPFWVLPGLGIMTSKGYFRFCSFPELKLYHQTQYVP